MNVAELNASILIVEPHQEILTQLIAVIEPVGLKIMIAQSGEQALDVIKELVPAIILLNSQLPGMDGFETCSRLKQHQNTQTVPIVFIVTERIDYKEILSVGSVGMLTKPFRRDEVLMHIHVHITQDYSTLVQENKQLKREMAQLKHQLSIQNPRSITEAKSNESNYQIPASEPTLIGHSPQQHELLKQIRCFSNSPLPVLIQGECGSGKELVEALHKHSAYATGPFVPVNCAATPLELAEAELFGVVRGAFTGAVKDRKGYFELAEGGTLFLDEIGEMPLLLQPKLLRALEHLEFSPVGGTHPKSINIRVIAATNANLWGNSITPFSDIQCIIGSITRQGFPQDLPQLQHQQNVTINYKYPSGMNEGSSSYNTADSLMNEGSSSYNTADSFAFSRIGQLKSNLNVGDKISYDIKFNMVDPQGDIIASL